jgi:hypothetical protein
MEPEGSLQHSQVPDNCPYPETARYSSYPHILLPVIRLNIIFSSALVSPKWSLSLRFSYHKSIYASPHSQDPQPTFLPQFERPSFTPIQYHIKIIILCILILKFCDKQSGRQKILHRMITIIH